MPLDGEISDWTTRNGHWLKQSQSQPKARAKRTRNTEPLILSGHGVHLRIDRDSLHIRNGFTHYPQEQESYCYFRGDLKLPTRIIMLDGSGGISFDVLAWLSQQSVVLIQLDWRGEVVAVIGGFGYTADPAKIEWQTETRKDECKRLAFCIDLVAQKITNTIATMECIVPPSKARTNAVEKAVAVSSVLKDSPPKDLVALRLLEATCANMYFAAWRGVELQWAAISKYPIPDTWRMFASRASLANGEKYKNVRATHPLNAMLNYAYGVRLTGLQVKAVAEGYDPTLGIMHHGYKGSKAFLFDLLEPERPKVDAAVLAFACAETFSRADFVIRNDGVCQLSPQLARRVVSLVATGPN
jgi:CRISPR-associated protein Cas1